MITLLLKSKQKHMTEHMKDKIGQPDSKKREKMPKDVFLKPSTRSYPVKVKRNGKWEYSPKLLRAAISDANRTGDKSVGDKASRLLAKLKKQNRDS